jgi:chromosome partitioning protein
MDQRIVIFSNAAPATGKSLTLAQVAVALLRGGHRVGTMDLDEDGEALSLFLHRRRDHDNTLPQPVHRRLPSAGRDEKTLATALTLALAEMAADCDIILIDAPRGAGALARMAHGYADIIVTPVNGDDLSSLVSLKGNTARIEKAAPYAEMLEDQALRRAGRDAHPATWYALRTRIPAKPLSNKRQSVDMLDKISSTLGFTPLAGLHERPLYNDLFAKGMTVSDLAGSLDLAAVAARQEVRSLVAHLIPGAQNTLSKAV